VATVVVPEFLRRWCDGHANVEVPGATVGEVVDGLVRGRPDLALRLFDGQRRIFPYILLFRNGDELPREGLLRVPVEPGDEIEIVAGAEGG
jgi:hypothetical protein